MKPAQPIAVVGVGGIFPDAPTPERFWENVVAGRCAAKRAPKGRWLLEPEESYSAKRGEADKVYSDKACFIEGFQFDPEGLALDAGLLERLDPVFHLALHAARAAWRDSHLSGVDLARVGVAIGNIVLPTDGASALTRELLIDAFLKKNALDETIDASPKGEPLNRFAAGLPAGLIARGLGLSGGAFTLDAACASSLYALKLAVDELRSGRADAMITGGVSRPESLYTQMGFSQLRALSPSGRPSPFDEAADGLVVGEGAGMFVLKRLDDALANGDRVYGVIRAVGLSNDVGGSLLAPSTEGQLRAMRQAYEEAGWTPSDVDVVECHATGTPTGDPIEVASLKALWGQSPWKPGQCVLGSVKSNVGHLLTAAGSAGLMKTLLSFKHGVIAPTANFNKPAAALGLEQSPFCVLSQSRPWPRREGMPRRAAVSAFGFGGINAHVLLEEPVAQRKAAGRGSVRPRSEGNTTPIAVVGLEARFGALGGARAFQEAVLGGQPPKTSLPDERWWGISGASEWRGHYLPDVSVDEKHYRIPPKELEETLPQQLLMLDVSRAALADARLKEAGRQRLGVFIGLGLDANTTNFHFRWFLSRLARQQGWELDESELPALSANRTMGALGGIVASRVAREFHAGGPSFTLSCEESSGLRALETAVRLLQQGEIDSALAGAVDIAGDARAVLSAASAKRYSKDGSCRPFDKKAGGAAVGEGAAALVLKRLSDAQRDGDRVYAVIKGVGSASGGFGSIEGLAAACAQAMRRAYAEAGVDVSTIGYLEAHGSGDPAEDAAEAKALADVFGTAAVPAPCAVGSSKTVVGHAGAAAGLAGFCAAALALYQEILPPFLAVDAIDELRRAQKRLHLPLRPQYWLRNRAEGPRRAAVTSLGVDGSASHAVLESYEYAQEPAQVALERRQPMGARSEALFVIDADDAAGLLSEVEGLRSWAMDERREDNVERLARRWFARRPPSSSKPLALALVARDWKELLELCRAAEDSIRENPERPIAGDRIHWSYRPGFGAGRLAFVFPGSGNQYVGMGVGLWAQWPEIPRLLDRQNGYLRSQMVPELFAPWRFDWPQGWEPQAESAIAQDYKSMIFGSVAHGAAVSDLIRSFGVSPDASIGYSLGETAGLFASGAWQARDEMLRRIGQSSLFVSDLAGPCDAARRFWNLPTEERVDWVLGVIDRPAETVKMALKGMERAALLIVNAPLECVVGGYRKAIDSLVDGLGCVFLPLQGVSTVHFPAAKLVEKQYRDLHLLPTSAPAGVRFYSAAWGKSYEVTQESAADSITAGAVRSFDFSALVRQAYEDGLRIFVELGPQSSCTRMIGKILGPLPHAAKSACVRGQEETTSVLRALALLVAERSPVDLAALYGKPTLACGHQDPPAAGRRASAKLGGAPFKPVSRKKPVAPTPKPVVVAPIRSTPAVALAPAASSPALAAFSAAQTATMRAHESFLSFSRAMSEAQARLAGSPQRSIAIPSAAPVEAPALNREQCLQFAVGKIGDVLGPEFAHVDAYPTRVRLPDEPLMLVDRILKIEGKANSLSSGRVVTEHDVLPGAWYLDAGRIPTCIAVEAGQADLFLSGYLGIDSKTKGLAVYRLLDAEVTFHGPLPTPGQVIHYDIAIERFVQHGDSWLFFFHYDGTVNGQKLITMRKGCAGFFTAQALAAGKGIVLSQDHQAPAKSPSSIDIESLRRKAGLPSSGRMRLVDRILELDLKGGRWGKGRIRAEADIHPDDWHLTCHFIDDNVMPGTLMYECCLHTMRLLLTEAGVAGDYWEPVVGVTSGLKCRGQVLASTKKVVYEIEIKSLENGQAVADALMYADGKPIVQITDMSLRAGKSVSPREPLFDTDKILAFAVGKPSEAFGKPYEVFDSQRVIARLPGPPYKFLDRIVDIRDCHPFKLAPGGRIVAEYDVPPNEWYFADHRQPTMPFSVLLEVALQPCGWLAAYLGSALTSPVDLCFRNLGGTATQFIEVTPEIGTLSMAVKVTKVAQSGGMIIQNFEFEMSCSRGVVYKGNTEFGFFTKEALSQQIGLRGAKLSKPVEPGKTADLSLLPNGRLTLLDEARLGHDWAYGRRRVDPAEWFFAAHFYQDPVCPGSLGLESFVSLLKLAAAERFGPGRVESLALGLPHTWLYRGQYTPVNKQVEVSAQIKEFDEKGKVLKADGLLSVDGLTIYQMKDFALRVK